MGFGYKTSWLAVRGATVAEVADVLRLGGRREAGWTEGTAAAYREGIYVAGPVDGWTLAHGRIDRTPGLGRAGTDPVGDCRAYPSVSTNPPPSSGSLGSGRVGSRTQPRC